MEIGSTVEVEYEITSHDKAYLSSFESFQFTQPLDKKSFEFSVPAGLAVHALVPGPKGHVTVHEKVDHGMRVMDWHAANVAPLPSEQQLPPAWSYNPGVQYYVGNVGDYWKALQTAMLARSRNGVQAAAQAQRLTASSKTMLEKIKIIRDFMARNIRRGRPLFYRPAASRSSPTRTRRFPMATVTQPTGRYCSTPCHALGAQPQFVMGSGVPTVGGLESTANVPSPG